jgi:hypothetical protein
MSIGVGGAVSKPQLKSSPSFGRLTAWWSRATIGKAATLRRGTFSHPGIAFGYVSPRTLYLSDDRRHLISAGCHVANEVVQPVGREALKGDLVAIDRLKLQ